MININHTLFVQMIDFLFLLFVLNIILYRPLLSKIKERVRKIEELKDMAEKLRGEAKENEEKYFAKIKEAEEEAKKNYTNTVSKALKEKEDKISQEQRKVIEEIREFRESINKQIELELDSSKDYSFEIASKIYRQIVE